MIKLTTAITQADTTDKQFNIGTRTVTSDGNEYVYMPGTTSVAQYDAVYFPTATGSVTRLATGVVGQVGIAQAAITANKFGWFQINGYGWVKNATTTSSGSVVMSSGTTGAVTAVGAVGDLISGMYTVGSGTGASGGTVKVRLSYPVMNQKSA